MLDIAGMSTEIDWDNGDITPPPGTPKPSGSQPDWDSGQISPPVPARGFKGWARDVGATAAKAAIAVPELAVGLADIPTGGRVGKFLENEGGAVGFRPKQAKEIVNEWHSDATKEAQRKFQEADGIVDKAATAIQNPSLIATAVGESLGPMGAGAVAARGLMAATRLGQMGAKGAALAGAAGEGAAMAGSAAEQIRQETDDGLLTPTQAGIAAATGVAGAALGVGGAKLAQRMGVGDADTMLAQGMKGINRQNADEAAAAATNPLVQQQAAKSIPRQVIEGAIAEGLFEELPQSVTEQVLQNIALGKDWHQDVDAAIVMGALSGGAMGGAAAGFRAATRPGETEARAPAPPAVPPAPGQPPQPGPVLGLPAPDRGVIEVATDGTARTPAYQAPGYVGDVTDVEPKIIDPVREQVATAAAQGGALSSAALTAIDTGAAAAVQPAELEAAQPAPISLEEADARDQAAYEQFFASADADPVVGRYFENDDDIPDFDAASNVSDEDFLRALGATDEDIQDAIATTRQPASPQGSAAVDAGAQANEPAGTGQGAGATADGQEGQVAPRQPSNFTGTPTATMGQQGATARPGPGFGLKDALAQIRTKKQQEAANAQAATPEAAPATTAVSAARPGAVETAGPATNIKTITAKQIPDMTDGELQQAIAHYGPAHKRTPKLQKEVQRRAAQTTQGSTNATQTAQAQQASPQPAQTGATPVAEPAPGQAGPAAPAGASTVRALNDGAPAQNTGAQSSTATGAQDATAAEPEFTTIKTVYGDSVTVRTADLNSDKPRLRQYTKNGKSKAVPAIHRDNLDLTGDKRAAIAKDDADNPLFNVITTKDGSTFANQAAASRELNRLAMGETHEVVAASEVQDGAQGFVIRRKLADAMGGRVETGANQVAAPTQQAQAATENVASNSAGQDEKARKLKSVADMNRMSGQFGAQINGVANGRLSVVGNPNATKQGRALMAAVDEARRAGATNEEIAQAATGRAAAAPAPAPAPAAVELTDPTAPDIADQSESANSRPGVVSVPPAIESALDADMQSQKARITRLRNEATKEGATLEEKTRTQTKLKAAESTLQSMRRTRFDAEDAAIKAIEQKDMAPFAEHSAFSKTEKALQELIGAAKPAAAPASKPTVQAERSEYPFGKLEAADTDEFHGQRVRVLPEMPGDSAWEGEVGMVLKHGRLLEVMRDGGDLRVRVPGDRVEILDPKAIATTPAGRFEQLRTQGKAEYGANEREQAPFKAFGAVAGATGESYTTVWSRWSSVMGFIDTVKSGTGDEVAAKMQAQLLKEPWANEAVYPGDGRGMAADASLLAWRNRADKVDKQAESFARELDREELRARDAENFGVPDDAVSKARAAVAEMRKRAAKAVQETKDGLSKAEERAKAEEAAEAKAYQDAFEAPSQSVLAKKPTPASITNWSNPTELRGQNYYTNGHFVDATGTPPHLPGWEGRIGVRKDIPADSIDRVLGMAGIRQGRLEAGYVKAEPLALVNDKKQGRMFFDVGGELVTINLTYAQYFLSKVKGATFTANPNDLNGALRVMDGDKLAGIVMPIRMGANAPTVADIRGYMKASGKDKPQSVVERKQAEKQAAAVEQALKSSAVEASSPTGSDEAKLTEQEAKSLMEWQDMGQKDGVKTHALTFYESQADKDAKRGRMIVAKVTKGDRSANNWMVEGDDKPLAVLGMAKKRAEEIGMAKAVADGFVEQGAPAPGNDRNAFTLQRLNRETGQMEPVTFERGEYVRYTLGGKDQFGDIDGISQARKEFSVDGLWYPFGFAYKAERPAAPKADAVPLSSVIDKVNAKNGQGLTDADRVPEQKPASKTPAVDRHNATMADVREGKATAEQFRASFEQVVDGKAAIVAELDTMTKVQLLREGGPFVQMRYANEKKADVVDAVYREMVGEYALGESVTYGMGRDSHQNAVRKLVEATDADKLAQYVKDRQDEIAEAQARGKARAAALENPKTLSDFRDVLNAKIREGMTRKEAFLTLTPQQRIQYDTLEAESTREARETRKRAQKTEVRAAGQTTAGEIVATKHTRDGYHLFVVKLADRLSADDYKTVLASAKKLGGWYSAFRGNGAIPGFQFKDKANAEAFLALAGGDTAAAQEQVAQRRDAFEDDRSQTAVERLRAMADKLEEGAAEVEGQERKTNTARRARFASAAMASAAADKAKAKTMRNIAQAIEDGDAKFLDAVRTKSQVDMLTGIVDTAKGNELRAKYPSYADQEKRKGEPPTAETADFAEFPSYSAFRSDLATLGRQMLEVDGTKKLGQRLMSVADDVTDAYLEFAKVNIQRVSQFGRGDALADFASKEEAERAIKRSGLTGKAIVLPIKRGQNRVILSPSEAIGRGLWHGDGDKRITLTAEFGAELVEAIGRRGNKQNKLSVPWQFQNAYDRRKALSRIGIETPSEFRAALREFISLKEQAIANRTRELELQMVGRKADGLDFFPTSAEVADQMIEAADLSPDMAVLEPSAGMGHLADRIRQAGAEPDVIEISADRRELLEEKGYTTQAVDDFLDLKPREFYTFGDTFRAPDGAEGIMRGANGNRVRLVNQAGDMVGAGYYDRADLTGVAHNGTASGYDRIIMNPPFSNRRDAEHVRHAYSLLKPGGRIVAIMGEGVFFGQDKKAQDFREWLESVGGTSEKLPEGSFMDPSLPVNTSVNARMVVIDKADGVAMFSSADATLPAKPLSLNRVNQLVQEALSGIRGAPPVEVTARPADVGLKVPAGSVGYGVTLRSGDMYVFQSAMGSDLDVFKTVFHELFHRGVRVLVPKGRYVQTMLDLAKGDSRIQQLAIEWKNTEMGQKQKENLREQGYTGADLTGQYEALAIEEALAAVAEEIKAEGRLGSKPKNMTIRFLANWLAKLADLAGMKKLAQGIRNMSYNEAERFVMSAIDRSGEPVQAGRTDNLSAKQAAQAGDQTQTENFRRWFGDSKVVDADGKPLVLYHGTRANFNVFGNIGGRFGMSAGYYFASSTQRASVYADGLANAIENWDPKSKFTKEVEIGANVMPVYLSIKNPLVITNKDGPFSSPEDAFDLNGGALVKAAKDLGHDGVIYRREKGDGFDEIAAVAFRPEQIKSAIGNNGTFDPADPDIRFRSATEAAKAAGDAIKSVTVTNIKQKAGFKLTDYLGIGLQALGRRQIVDLYGDMLPLAEYNRLVTQMEADKNEGGAEADQLVTRWAKLPDEAKLADLMHDATLAQIDPDKPYVDGDDKAVHMMLQGRFKALSDDAKAVYRATRDAYRAHHAKVRSAIKDRIERSEIKGERKAALLKQMDDEFFKAIKGVYFPLARFGQYAVTVKGPDGKVESVSRAETKAEAEALRSNLLAAFPRDKGFTVGRVMLSKDFIADRDAVGRGFMTELYQVLDKQDMDAAQRAELEDTLGQLYLSSLPDLSWAKHGIHRKGTPGFSQDARRAYAQNMFHGARYLAKLRYSDLMQDELTAMQKHVDDWREVEDFDQNSAQRVVDEMNKRHESLMNPKSNPLSTALTSLGFVFHLGLSPASAMVNLSQTALVAYPIMGAKWGFNKASAALLKASKQAAAGKNDITGSLNADERAAYDEAVRAGTIDVTMAHDLAGIAQGEDAGVMWKIRPVMRWASFLFHNAERFNRQVTFVAAYRLARDAGANHKVAFDQATKATYDGHFDYGAANRPRIMQGNVAKVLLLFKQYGQNMVYTLSRNAYQSIKGTDAEKAEARKALAGLLASHAMAAGVLGLPMVSTLLAAASMVGGDDDEPWDAKVALQNMLADAFGQKPAEVLAHGLSRLTPWDISGRVGLDRLIFPDVQEGLEGQRLAESAMAAALGPVAGIGVNVLKGAQHMSEGRYAMGLEAMLPSALRGPVKALRYAEEGVQDKSGISILDQVSPAAVAGQALGFSPSAARNAQEGKSAILAHDRALGERRQELLTKIARATMAKDEEAKAEAREEIRRFNEKNPGRRINPNHIMASVRGRQKRIDQAQDGVYLPRNRREAMEAGRFATSE